MSDKLVIDLRSDTLTHPTPEMRKAMFEAEVGDDVFGEDPTVNRLQKIAAAKFGKEDALFVSTGTMGNLVSMMVHCWRRGEEVYAGESSHIYNWEQGGGAQLGGIFVKGIKNLEDGRVDLEDVRRKHRDGSDIHHCTGRVVALENPINGKVLPVSYFAEVRDLADELDLKVHLDGARLANAVATLKCDVLVLMKYVDSASICLSKGLCAPVGSVIVGSHEFINKARRVRKVLGGGMRQSGILAAAGILALTDMWDKVAENHAHAEQFGKGLLNVASDLFELDLLTIETNMVVWKIKDTAGFTAQEFTEKAAEITEENKTCLKVIPMSSDTLRAVFFYGFFCSTMEPALKKIQITCNYFRDIANNNNQNK